MVALPFTRFDPFRCALQQLFPVEIRKRENLLADMLVKGGVLSQADAATAIAGAPELSVMEYFQETTNASATVCDALTRLAELAGECKIPFDSAVVAANHIYKTGVSLEESLLLVTSPS